MVLDADSHPFLTTSRELLAVLDSEGRIRELGNLWYREFGLSGEEVRGAAFAELFVGEEREVVRRAVEEAGSEVQGFTASLMPAARRRARSVEWQILRQGDRIYLAGCLDSAALREKQLLLNELLHRTKNNLTTITAVLNLQITTLSDKLAIEALEDARSRVQSMLLLYEKLAGPEQIREMPIDSYLAPLAHDIVDLFPPSKNVLVETEVEPFTVSAKQLSSIGFIVNELVTNAMKHAFEGRDDGMIIVGAREEGREAVVVVEDNGNGLADDPAAGRWGLGFALVHSLVEELDGILTISSSGGTRVELRFPL